MEEFRKYSEKANATLDRARNALEKLNSLAGHQKISAVKQLTNLLNTARSDLENCKITVDEMDSLGDKGTANSKLAELTEKLDSCTAALELNNVVRNHAVPPPQQHERLELAEMNRQEMLQAGDGLHEGMLKGLEQSRAIAANTKQVVGDIQRELHEQDEQIDRIEDKTSGIKSMLKVSKMLMNQIYRRYLTDKCIVCLIIVIILVIAFLIGYGALGLDESDSFNTPDDRA